MVRYIEHRTEHSRYGEVINILVFEIDDNPDAIFTLDEDYLPETFAHIPNLNDIPNNLRSVLNG
jgi:hypothetical protein